MQSTLKPRDLKAARKRHGKTLAECAAALGISIEGYRLKELGRNPITTAELARLAALYGEPVHQAFPSWRPTETDRLVAEAVVKGVA